MNIVFKYKSTHNLFANGTVFPAFTSSSRLYVIYDGNGAPSVYVGTATDVQDRFYTRLSAIRELNISQAHLNNIFVAIVQIEIDGVFYPPHNNGISNGVDVEHLLIRIYSQLINANIRNLVKVNAFTSAANLTFQLVNECGITNFGNHNYFLNTGQVL